MNAPPAERLSPTPALIMDAALELAAEHGWGKLTVRALADRLGYAPPILYQHFDNKEHLLHSLMETGFARLISEMKDASHAALNAERALVAVALARFSFAERQPTLHSLMFATGGPCWQREATFAGMMEGAALIRALLQKISGRQDACHDLIANFIALIKGYSFFACELPNHVAFNHFFTDITPNQALARAMERFISSISPQPSVL